MSIGSNFLSITVVEVVVVEHWFSVTHNAIL